MSLVTIARFSKPEDAHLLRLRLEAGGVTAFVQDENLVQMDWLLSNAIGGVRLQVNESDLEDVRALLAEEPLEAPDRPACPKCASLDTRPDELPRRFSFLCLFLIGFPLLLARRRWRCVSCGKAWNA